MYVYEMIQEMSRVTEGIRNVNTRSVAIYRLQEHGYILETKKCIADNRTHIYVATTESGQAHLQALIQEYRRLIRVINQILAQDGKLYGEDSECTKKN